MHKTSQRLLRLRHPLFVIPLQTCTEIVLSMYRSCILHRQNCHVPNATSFVPKLKCTEIVHPLSQKCHVPIWTLLFHANFRKTRVLRWNTFPHETSCAGGRHNMPHSLQVDLWPFEWCPSHVWRGLRTSVSILVFLGLSVLDLGPMYPTDRQTSDIRQTRIIA